MMEEIISQVDKGVFKQTSPAEVVQLSSTGHSFESEQTTSEVTLVVIDWIIIKNV